MRPLKAGLIYFLLIFALGWVLGPIRELWAVPQFGRITALLFEAVMMLIAMVVSSRWVMRRFNVPQTLGSTIPMGLVALAILAPAEIAGVLWVRGLSRREYLASFVTTSGVISLVMFLLFAAMPTLVMLPRAYIRAHNQRPSREEETRRVNCMRAASNPGFSSFAHWPENGHFW